MANKTTFTTGWVNSNLRIKVYGIDNDGKKINKLLGVSGIIALTGEQLFYKFLTRAWNSMQDVTVCKLRRGLQVSLYVK